MSTNTTSGSSRANVPSPLAAMTRVGGNAVNGDDDTYTVDGAIEAMGFGRVQWRVTAMCGILWAADGVESTILAIVAPEARCVFHVSPWKEAFLTTVVFTGMLIGAAPWGRIADVYGRKQAITLSTLAVIYFGVLSAFSPNYWWLLALRAIFGFALAGLPQSVTYFMEMVPSKTRGSCSAFLQLVYSVGMVAAAGMSIGVMSSLNWRYLLAFSVFVYIIVLPLVFLAPESPIYFASRGWLTKAMESLRIISKGNNRALPEGKLVARQSNVPETELDDSPAQTSDSNKATMGVLDLFRPLRALCTTLLLWLIWFLVAFSYFGLLLMTTELLSLYHTADPSQANCLVRVPAEKAHECHSLTTKDYIDVLWTSLAEFPAIVICYGLNRLLPRRLSIAVHGGCSSLVGGLLLICPMTRGATIGLIFVMRSFLSSLFITLYLYTSEVYPTQLRATGLGAAYTWGRVGGITTPFIAQVMLHSTVRGTKLFYAVTSLLAGIAGLLLPVETKGRSLENNTWGEDDGDSKSSHKYKRLH